MISHHKAGLRVTAESTEDFLEWQALDRLRAARQIELLVERCDRGDVESTGEIGLAVDLEVVHPDVDVC